MSISEWPAGERPRERLLARGAGSLSDAELLAVLLGNGVRGMDAVSLGRELLRATGGLSTLLGSTDMPPLRGLGPAKHARLAAAMELARRALGEDLERGNPLRDPVDSAAYLKARLRHLPHEVFACLYLDNRHRVLGFEELFRGTIDGASVHAREVVRACMKHNAAAVIFAHNHPSGVAEPSRADRDLTLHLREALRMIDVRVLDHIVVGSGLPVSLASRGLL
jgi:DNA repair protein RadC